MHDTQQSDSEQKESNHVSDVEALARLLDSRFNIPGFNMKFGIDSLIGLIPVVGDIFTALLGLYIIGRAILLGGSATLIVRMFINLIIDAVLGAFPFLGDVFDLAFRSNSMNINMLIKHLEKKGKLTDAKHNA
ncbi:DUF4112 domain-containing protein [Hirschia maritima]|uniref:DUF4112 domain-containing protein n=1 Tax=Hirschia maritima TaxID=1121961 RepID=UPI00036B71CD|nr:DUF4112 domain-containing protein [Hirschia maritima]